MPGAKSDAGKFPEQVGFFRDQRSTAIDGHGVFAVVFLHFAETSGGEIQRFVPRRRPKSLGRPQQRIQEPVRVPALQVTLHAFRAKHSVVEWEFFPRFKANHPVAADFELNAALLAAETTMRFHELVRQMPGFVEPAARGRIGRMRPESFCQNFG